MTHPTWARPAPATATRAWHWATLWPLVVREWRHHPWRHAVALLAVTLGVALAWSVHLINRSALGEFAAAVRSANGEPDLTLRGQREGFDDAWLARVLADESVAQASAVVEWETHARGGPAAARVPVRVLGVDALRIATLAPDLAPLPQRGEDPLVFLDAGVAFVNGAARERLVAQASVPASAPPASATIELQSGTRWAALRVAGDVAAGGPPLVVVDLAAAQALFDPAAAQGGRPSRLSRIDLRLVPGTDVSQLVQRLALPPAVLALPPEAAEQRVSNLSRAYRVNLAVLALVALFVGAFLVYSVVSLSVAQRTPAFALLGVLGLTARGRRALVLGECALVGLAGGTAGVALGTGLAAAALRWLAGDLGGGYFPGVQPPLHWSTPAAMLFIALGMASALAGGHVPAKAAERLRPAQALKGLGDPDAKAAPAWPALALLAFGTALAFAPPIAGLPLAAYVSVAALLSGGVAWVPGVVHGLTAARRVPRSPLALLAWRRAGHQRATATAATAGVVASLALSVALTVMVASFRTSVAQWLDQVLPANLYARSAATAALAEAAWLPADFEPRVAALPGVLRASASRVRSLQLAPGRPAVSLMARPLVQPGAGPQASPGAHPGGRPGGRPGGHPGAPALAFVEPPLPPHGSLPDVFVSEAVLSLYGARPGSTLVLPLGTTAPGSGAGTGTPAREHATPVDVAGASPPGVAVHVRGVYRDFARQFGSVTMDRALYRELTGDTRLNDVALWLAPGADAAAVTAAVRALLPDPSMLDFATTGELREISLSIFDRSFAVTYYLQAVAIAIGLVGIAASLSAQVLARRKELGLLAHLGLTRRQLLAVVTGEAAAWIAAGVLVGLGLGLAVSAVLVHVVNPQSFHWTMEMVLPGGRLAALAAAVFVAGTLTSAWAARGATARSAVLSVKEDW
ncbi:MAG: ABC transporter permease [Rubrivivax sp.]|nr:ABC transporter permease [Rubrivivax sp.]